MMMMIKLITEIIRLGNQKVPPPPIINEYTPDKDKSDLEGRIDKDFAWALAASSGNQKGIKGHEVLDLDKIEDEEETNDFVGSWTAFNKKVTSVETKKSRNEYLPTIPILQMIAYASTTLIALLV